MKISCEKTSSRTNGLNNVNSLPEIINRAYQSPVIKIPGIERKRGDLSLDLFN